MSTPADLAAAASQVDGVTVTAGFRQSTKTGDGFVRWDGCTRDPNGFGYVDRWQVIVMVPADIAQAEDYLRTKVPQLLAACEPVIHVTGSQPQQLALAGGTVPCVFITGTREQE